MTNRRSFLKWFGAGAVVSPVIAGVARGEAMARIIEPPKVEIIEAPKVVAVSAMRPGEYDATIYLRHKLTGEVVTWQKTITQAVGDFSREMHFSARPGLSPIDLGRPDTAALQREMKREQERIKSGYYDDDREPYEWE